MKSTLKWSLLVCLLSIGVHLYSTSNYYPVRMGVAETESACNINATFNCDAVTASRYSDLFGIPLSLWGVMTHLSLLVVLIVLALGWTEHRDKWMRKAFAFSAFIAFMSFVMGSIAFGAIGTFCITCVASYFLSILLFFLIYKAQEAPILAGIREDLRDLPKGHWKNWVALSGLIVLGSFFVNGGIKSNYVEKNFDKIALNSVLSWKANPKYEFPGPAAITKGSGVIEIVEFADFMCGHCKRASTSLGAFMQANYKSVKLKFYSFPLDSTCNEAMTQGGGGKRCALAKSVICAEQQGKGWSIHDQIFKDQNEFFGMSLDQTMTYLKGHVEKLGLDAGTFQSCMDSEDTHETVLKHAQLGANAKVKGTPSIYVDGRYLPGGQFIPILESAIIEAKKGKN